MRRMPRAAERKSYRRKPPIERLPEGIPDWFARDDADGDGQIAMSEFSVSWTDGVLAEYNQFDLNRDGLITPSECLAAKNKGAVRGGSIGAGGSRTARRRRRRRCAGCRYCVCRARRERRGRGRRGREPLRQAGGHRSPDLRLLQESRHQV